MKLYPCLHFEETDSDEMYMSASLKDSSEHKGGRTWLNEMAESSALMSGALRVMHPNLYSLGRSSIEKLAQ